MSSTMSGYSPKAIFPIAKKLRLHNTEHGKFPQTLQTLQTLQTRNAEHRTRNAERGTILPFHQLSVRLLTLFLS